MNVVSHPGDYYFIKVGDRGDWVLEFRDSLAMEVVT